MNNQVALEKLRRYCAYQERCHQEVRSKLLSLKVYGDDLEEIISELIDDNYLNEERFATAYARGKFRMKRWGRIKIMQELKRRQISAYLIKKGLAEIDEKEYLQAMRDLIDKYSDKQIGQHPALVRKKTANHLFSKGYESNLVYEYLANKNLKN